MIPGSLWKSRKQILFFRDFESASNNHVWYFIFRFTADQSQKPYRTAGAGPVDPTADQSKVQTLRWNLYNISYNKKIKYRIFQIDTCKFSYKYIFEFFKMSQKMSFQLQICVSLIIDMCIYKCINIYVYTFISI
jgi:hypothetical protein